MLSYSGDGVVQNTSPVCEHSFKNGNHLVNIPFFSLILGTSPKAFTSTTDLS